MSILFEQISLPYYELPIILTLASAVAFYFGRLIGEVKVERYTKYNYYIEGMVFSLVYILLPTTLSIWIITNLGFKLPIFLSVFLLIFTSYLFSHIVTSYEIFMKYRLFEEFANRIDNEINKMAQKSKIIRWFYQNTDFLKSTFNIDYKRVALFVVHDLPIKYLSRPFFSLTFSFLSIFSFISVVINGIQNILLMSISIVFLFFSLSFIALTYGYSNAYYPKAKLYIKDGKMIEGRILKFDEFIYILNENKKIFVNKNDVVMIEEDLWKEK